MDDMRKTVYRLLPAAERREALESDWKMAFPDFPNTSRISLLSEKLTDCSATSATTHSLTPAENRALRRSAWRAGC
jgi:hypothetical protein